MEQMKTIFGLIGILFIIGGICLILIAAPGEEQCSKQLCVDGDGDINLEGIMCNKCKLVVDDGFYLGFGWVIYILGLFIMLEVLI